jgi:type I restriction enzyme R subunit
MLFDPVVNKQDSEALERFLEPEDRRQHFYDALNEYARTLKVALGAAQFYEDTPETQINAYKRSLAFFHSLRTSVKLRYAETIDYGEYEEKIRKLLNDHIKAEGVSVITPEVNIFDEEGFEAAVAHLTSPASRADTIAYRLKRTATEKMEEDPAFYRKFSQLVEETIEQYKLGRISELEYLNQMEAGMEQMRTGRDSSLPSQLGNYQDASAYYGLLLDPISRCVNNTDASNLPSLVADLAIQFELAINRHKVRDWAHNPTAVNDMKNALEDHLYAFPLKSHTALRLNRGKWI